MICAQELSIEGHCLRKISVRFFASIANIDAVRFQWIEPTVRRRIVFFRILKMVLLVVNRAAETSKCPWVDEHVVFHLDA